MDKFDLIQIRQIWSNRRKAIRIGEIVPTGWEVDPPIPQEIISKNPQRFLPYLRSGQRPF